MSNNNSAGPDASETNPVDSKKSKDESKDEVWDTVRLAKGAIGLSRSEKRALYAIADASTMKDRCCRKSKYVIDQEFATSPRDFQYGIHGRKTKDGREIFPGLKERGIVTSDGPIVLSE